MDLEQLLKDLKSVRVRGIPKTRLDDVPALMDALTRRRPDLDAAGRSRYLEEFLAEAADQLDDHDALGLRLALGIGGLSRDPANGRVRNSADRRAAFAAHYHSVAETVRRRGGLEDQTLAKLGKAILGLHELAATPAISGEAPPTSTPSVPRAAPPAQALMPTTTSRSRAYYAIDSFEQDLRFLVESRLLDHLPPEAVVGAASDELNVRRAQADSEAGPLTQYMHPHHAYDALLINAAALPTALAEDLRRNLSAFDGFLPVRSRLMHGRPLQPDDLEKTDSFLRRFRSGQFRQTELALTQLAADPGWQPRPRLGSRPPERILHNLPSPDFDETGLLGREEQITDIVSMVKRRREPITLVGEGGIGKTALALEICYRLADDPQPPFDAILWTSLKSERLEPAGVMELSNAVRDIDGAARELGQAIDPSFQGRARDLAGALGDRSTLIVIDNLETALGQEVVDLYDALPHTVTLLFTSRVGIGQIERPVSIGPLEAASAESLFRSFARDRGQYKLAENPGAVVSAILDQLRYSPLAIRWYILSVESGQTPTNTLRNQEGLLRFCVGNVVDGLGSDEKRLLHALRVLDRPLRLEELAASSGMDIDSLRSSAHRLLRSSLLVWSQAPSPVEADLGSELLALSSTARAFLRSAPESETGREIVLRDIAYKQERELERGRIADHGRYLDPNVIFERSDGDAPTAHLLKQALRENKSGHTAAATETMARARAISPDYFEVDRVDALLAGYRRETERATALFRSALGYCATDEESSWVGYFFANHLARQVHDLPAAIRLSEEAHEIFDSYDTALQLGNFNVWSSRFVEGQRLIESALERAPGKPRFERIATTSLVECFRRWSEDIEAGDAHASLDHALHGAVLGLGLHESGSTDEALMGSILVAVGAALRAAKRMEEFRSDEEARLADVLQRIAQDDRFTLMLRWRDLEFGMLSLTPEVRYRLAPSFVTTTTEAPDQSAKRLLGSVTSIHEKFGFIAHDDFPNNVFFHGGSLRFPATLTDLGVGSLVEFTPSKNQKGQDQALDVLPRRRDPDAASIPAE